MYSKLRGRATRARNESGMLVRLIREGSANVPYYYAIKLPSLLPSPKSHVVPRGTG